MQLKSILSDMVYSSKLSHLREPDLSFTVYLFQVPFPWHLALKVLLKVEETRNINLLLLRLIGWICLHHSNGGRFLYLRIDPFEEPIVRGLDRLSSFQQVIIHILIAELNSAIVWIVKPLSYVHLGDTRIELVPLPFILGWLLLKAYVFISSGGVPKVERDLRHRVRLRNLGCQGMFVFSKGTLSQLVIFLSIQVSWSSRWLGAHYYLRLSAVVFGHCFLSTLQSLHVILDLLHSQVSHVFMVHQWMIINRLLA